MDKVQQQLAQLRQQIDQADSQLVSLLTQRLALTKQVGEVKSEAGLPIYVPQRETDLIAQRRQQATDAGLNPELVEDLLRRIMRESYQSQNAVGYTKIRKDTRHIVVVGGKGKLGGLFVRLFEASGYRVETLEQANWHQAETLLVDAAAVLVSVPINVTEQVIADLPPLPDDCLLVDVTSTKSRPLKAMLDAHKGPVLGLHPMFGPDVGNLVRQVVIVCEGRDPESYNWLLQQLLIWSLNLYHTDAEAHDQAMALIQVMKHFSSFVYGKHLKDESADIAQLLSMSSPIYRLELAMVGRLFAQDSTLYADIIFSDPANVDIVERYSDRLADMVTMLRNNDKAQFKQRFAEIAKWFGDYSDGFLSESRSLLHKAQDVRSSQ